MTLLRYPRERTEMTTLVWLTKTGIYTEKFRRMASLRRRKRTKEISLNLKIRLLIWTPSFSYFYTARIKCQQLKTSKLGFGLTNSVVQKSYINHLS